MNGADTKQGPAAVTAVDCEHIRQARGINFMVSDCGAVKTLVPVREACGVEQDGQTDTGLLEQLTLENYIENYRNLLVSQAPERIRI